MKAVQIDRWLLNHAFRRRRIFTVRLVDCVDELGHSFGKDGDHFFIRALACGTDEETVAEALRRHYAVNAMPSMNHLVGRDIGTAGACYFLPWEEDRIRPLSKFEFSHKAGPTPEAALRPIVKRLLDVLRSIKAKGFRPALMMDGYPRVIVLEGAEGTKRFLVRDGSHRLAALSHLGIEEVRVCLEKDHWISSAAFRFLRRILRGRKDECPRGAPATVREVDAKDWPHVRSGLLTETDGRAVFTALYGNCMKPNSGVRQE